MNTVQKGDRLEDQLHRYLLEQLNRNELIYGVYPAKLCKLHRKKKYFCAERGADVEFDVVIEVQRENGNAPHMHIIFECKNHISPIQERDVTDFSDKIGRIFGHSVKGILVMSSRLQSGAESLARSRKLGIAKFDSDGLDVVADRKSGIWSETSFLEGQFTEKKRRTKSLKFSALYEGRYFYSPLQLLLTLAGVDVDEDIESDIGTVDTVPFVSDFNIQRVANAALSLINYDDGPVDLEKVCVAVGLNLFHSDELVRDADGNIVLGSVNFEEKKIVSNIDQSENRRRFTVAHEIGHFLLEHEKYFHSETIIENDLFLYTPEENSFNYDRLEFQANVFASFTLLPELQFMNQVKICRERLDIFDKGFGYIFIDDQPCNVALYNNLLFLLSDHFKASKQAIETRMKRAGLITDNRQMKSRYPFS